MFFCLSVKLKVFRQQKVGMNVVHKIINKKKKKLKVKTNFSLPLFGGSTKKMFENPEVGPNFSKLCSKYGCVLEGKSV